MRAALLLFLLALLARGQTNPLAGDAAAIDVGKGNFRLYCAPCHGIHAQGGRGPDLTRGNFSAGNTDTDLFRVISAGVQGTDMTGYGERFDDQMIWRLVAFIRSAARVTPEMIAGDPAHGRAIFQGKGGCAACHATTAGPPQIGPSLDRVGRQRSLQYLREKLLDPNQSITPGYSTVAVKLPDGRTLRGIEIAFDDFSSQFMDVNRQFHSFRKEEAASIEREPTSLMPSDYGRRLTPSEQTDIVAYLSTLRGAQ
jgi:putative heme-binding domain-containing protein